MQKIDLIIFIFILFSGCSLIRKGEAVISYTKKESISENLIDKILKQNISNKGFFIEKAEITTKSENGTYKFLGSIKYEAHGKYLISIRNKTGIEVARVFLSNDTVLANDRINRRLYYGKPVVLIKKYKIASSVLPVIFGDIINVKESNDFIGSCLNNNLSTTVNINGLKVSYRIDCKRDKVIQTIVGNSDDYENVEIKFSNFKKKENVNYPGTIKVMDLKKKVVVEINVIRLNIPWKGNLEFIPGKKYEKIQL